MGEYASLEPSFKCHCMIYIRNGGEYDSLEPRFNSFQFLLYALNKKWGGGDFIWLATPNTQNL